jgi:amino acid permease
MENPLVAEDSSGALVNLTDPANPENAFENAVPLKSGHTRVGFLSTIINLLNVLIGAGILGIPSTFDDSGMILGLVLMTGMAFLSWIATVMTLILQERTGSEGMDEIALRTMGRKGMVSLSVMILIFNICALIAYLIIATDFILSWLKLAKIDASGRWPRAGIVAVYGLALPIALSIPKNLNFLASVSSVMVCLIVFYLVAVVYEMGSAVRDDGIAPSIKLGKIDMRIFASISVCALAFALPTCVCPVVCDSDPDVKVRNRACFWALLISLILCAVPAVSSYLQFGDTVDGNMLNTYQDDDKLMIAVRIGFFLCLTFSYPATHPPVICSWSELLFKENNAIDLTGWKRLVALVVTNAIPLVIAMLLPDMKPILEIGGALGGCIGSFSYPAVMWVLNSERPKTHWKNVLSIAFVVYGCATGILSTYYAVLDAIESFKH